MLLAIRISNVNNWHKLMAYFHGINKVWKEEKSEKKGEQSDFQVRKKLELLECPWVDEWW